MLLTSVNGKVRVPNLTQFPQRRGKHDHFCQLRLTDIIEETKANTQSSVIIPSTPINKNVIHTLGVDVDPDNQLPKDVVSQFRSPLREFVDPHFKRYNGAVGPFEAVVNMGPVQPPQRKGRLLQYSKGQLQELQDTCKFDELENIGVFKKPEDLGITTE